MLFLLLHVYSSTNGDAYRRGFPDSTALSVMHLSPLGSQVSFTTVNTTRIENVADWEAISKKYRALVGHDSEDGGSMKDSEGDNHSTNNGPGGGGNDQMGNNVNANKV